MKNDLFEGLAEHVEEPGRGVVPELSRKVALIYNIHGRVRGLFWDATEARKFPS
jgi:hypothetical protein